MLQIDLVLLMRQSFNVIYPSEDNCRSHVTKQLFSLYTLSILTLRIVTAGSALAQAVYAQYFNEVIV